MGLFTVKKKEENKELPPLQFPELPKTVPAYEPNKTPTQQPRPVSTRPIQRHMAHELPGNIGGMEKPLFIKIEKYKDVIDNLRKLKNRLGEAENILNKLHRLKDEEDRELAAWQQDLAKIRTQLMDVDKKLFE